MNNILNVTIHVGSNSGSVLQTYATCYIFKKFGCIVKTLNYIPPRVTWRRYFRGIHSFKSLLSRLFLFPLKFIERYFIFGRFLKKYCNLTNAYYSLDEVVRNIPEVDIYMAGSDQLWNSSHNEGIDEVYYYNYLPHSAKRISFASSIGKESLSDEEIKIIAPYLKKFSCISVREKSAKLLFRKMGINNVTQILDPTLLMNKSDWSKLVDKRIIKEKYLLVYIPYNACSKKIIMETAKVISSKYNVKIVSFAKHYWGDSWADKNIKLASPTDFLSLFMYADFVLTNSFHGTAFSINLNKQFWVYNPSQFSTRISSLLELTGLENRLLSDKISDINLKMVIDYACVNNVLNHERERAFSFINRAIN